MNWFPDWLAIHLRRHTLAGLPTPADNFDFYEAWRLEFARLGLTEQAALRASQLLVSRSYAKGAHFPALVKLATALARSKSSAESSAHADATCGYCDGHGTVEVIDDAWGYRWGAFCLCNYGRARLHQTQEAMKTGVLLDYGRILEGRGYTISRRGESRLVTFRQAHVDEECDYTHHLPPGHLRDLAEKLRPPGVKRAPSPSPESSDAEVVPVTAARRLEGARRDRPRALPVPAHAPAEPVHPAPVRAG